MKPIMLIRIHNGIGIDKYGNGYLIDGTPVKRRFYSSLCYVHKKLRVGYKTLSNSKPVNFLIIYNLPF